MTNLITGYLLTGFPSTIDEVEKRNQGIPRNVIQDMKSIMHEMDLEKIALWKDCMANSPFAEIQSKVSALTHKVMANKLQAGTQTN